MRTNEKQQTTLGALIRMERKKAGLTQFQLGKMIGLGESRVSKIENGAPITPEEADYILGKMGSELQLKVIKKAEDASSISFITTVVYWFSKFKGISLGRAFRYLRTFKGLEYLTQFIEIERTLSYEEITDNLTLICSRNGGRL
ncbi:MAG: DUF3791 domain-containing protein [Muribaculaceae bacterium]|nr:DUF3791 domain-containing protein [Muribaculaceae bacterium]